MNREDRDNYVSMIARVFVRSLRDMDNANPAEIEFSLTEGQATSLLMERERSTGAAHWRRELRSLCELIVERARTVTEAGHTVSVMDHPDAGMVLTRAERLLHELETTTFRAGVAPTELAERLRARAHWARTAQIEGQRAHITELDAKLFDEAALALHPMTQG